MNVEVTLHCEQCGVDVKYTCTLPSAVSVRSTLNFGAPCSKCGTQLLCATTLADVDAGKCTAVRYTRIQ